ncbi:CBM9 family sugar-binding protein [Winogradskyella sp.]|nr:CBM9 family sugar-binding protein [Winogradskyella sp.]MDC1505224.1 CBM9 family sugar-binding protein [Winogradskyella sp.]
MKHLVFILFLIPFISSAQEKKLEPKLANISWITGTWHGEAFGGVTEEIWSEPSGGSMMATFKLINDGKVTFYEIEVIREIENSLLLQLKHFGADLKGWETKDETVDFPLKYITETKVVFEGMTFEKISKTEMNIYVDIENKGKTETVTFNYKKKLNTLKPINQLITVKKAPTKPLINGIADDAAWANNLWLPLDQLWLGNPYAKDDFSGRYKLSWSEDALYLLAEIKDDILVDTNADPLMAWWDDDCLEIFIDEDHSGGEHQFNHNAFAYHIALDGNVVDMSTTKKGKLFNSHIESQRVTNGNTTIWEVKISLYNDTYKEDKENTPLTIVPGKLMGFALAYCDNDKSKTRENFIGSIPVEGNDKNKGWIDANIFGTLKLIN